MLQDLIFHRRLCVPVFLLHRVFVQGTHWLMTCNAYASFIHDTTHSCVTWLIHMWHDSFICDRTYSYVTWLVHMWHDSFICDMTHSYVTWLIYDSYWRDTTHLYVTYQARMFTFFGENHIGVELLLKLYKRLFTCVHVWFMRVWKTCIIQYSMGNRCTYKIAYI